MRKTQTAKRIFRAAVYLAVAAAAGIAVCLSASAQTAASSPQVFREARAAAAKLPPLLAARELGMIAQDEMVAIPQRGLTDFKLLYQQVSQWQTGGDTRPDLALAQVQSMEQAHAIEAYAAHAQFQQALAWLQPFHASRLGAQTTGMVYSQVIVQMLAHGHFSEVRAAFLQSAAGGDDFPFVGAATALDAQQLAELQRMSIATQGLAAAPDPEDAHPAAIFYGAVVQAFPSMAGQVESAIVGLLAVLKADAAAHHGRSVFDARSGSMLLSVLDQFDRERAQAAKTDYPAAAGASFGGGMVYQTSPTGQIAGATLGPTPEARIYHMAAGDPDRAMAEASGLKDKVSRFAALAGVAQQLAKTRPALAARAASQAYDLLDQGIAAAETGYAANLANAFETLGEDGKAQQVADIALDAADTHAQQAQQQFDLSTPEAVAKVTHDLLLPAVALSYPYENLAPRFPTLTLQHARNCQCAVAKPLILAKIAEGMTPAGAKAAH